MRSPLSFPDAIDAPAGGIVRGESPAAHPEIVAGEVHLWRARLDLQAPQLARLAATLSSEERARGGRLHRTSDRSRFLAARGILRSLLGRYLECEPERLDFRYGSNGKPELAGRPGGAALQFNVSHSGACGLFAFATDRSVGVDVEAMRPVREARQIAARYYTPRERAALRSAPDADRHALFLRYWTCKEAALKAMGAGVSRLHMVEIELHADRSAAITRIDGETRAASRWFLEEVSPRAGYVGAIVAGRGKGVSTVVALDFHRHGHDPISSPAREPPPRSGRPDPPGSST
jgi:4'-phosphopantetheinyl transferase